ncbi:farnesol dehydrogenase-like [Chironomus tepperi]|uniref:farnesol dehydrogenase-like n=1 Tax=Chironomus tepperi TaxID=113505 RepID=UPI00391F3B8B
MDKWKGKVAVITGASSGIGAGVVKDFAKSGIIVVALARRASKIEANVKDFPAEYGQVYALSCDITSLESIKETFDWIEQELGSVNILVNNAGIGWKTAILTENSDADKQFADIINTNFTGLVHVTRHAYLLMKKSEDYSMIININSVAGHRVPFFSEGQESNVYHGTKYAITATTEILRQELIAMKNDKIRVSSVSPGVVQTDFFTTGCFLPEGVLMKDIRPALYPSDISNVIMYLLELPYHVNITEVTVRPVLEAF